MMTNSTPGFQRRTFLLEFQDPSFHGLEVRTRSASLDVLFRMQTLMSTDLGPNEHAAERKEFYQLLAGGSNSFGPLPILVSWNLLDDHNEPVPITPDQLSKEEWPMVRAIVLAWIGALASVPPPLSQPSSAGAPSEELNLSMVPMEPISTTEEPVTNGQSPAATRNEGSDPLDVKWWENPESSNTPSGS
jgi:hypothetical protein